MNKRELHQLLRSELITAIDYVVDKMLFLISIERILNGKDGLPETTRFSTETMHQQDKIYNSLVKEYNKNHSRAIKHICDHSSIIPNIIKEDILFLLQELTNLESHKYERLSLYNSVEQEFTDDENFLYFKKIILIALKFNAVFNEIDTGLQEYGVDPYKVSDKDSHEEFDIIDEVYNLSIKDIDEQLDILLKENEMDSEMEYKNKKEIKKFLKKLKKEVC